MMMIMINLFYDIQLSKYKLIYNNININNINNQGIKLIINIFSLLLKNFNYNCYFLLLIYL